MAGKKHQFILGLIIKKMCDDGVVIKRIDGRFNGSFGDKYKLPPKIERHRPDVVGVNNGGVFCIGEAKTENDLGNKRTYEQIMDFTNLRIEDKFCNVYIGIPMSSRSSFISILISEGINVDNLNLICVPDLLIE